MRRRVASKKSTPPFPAVSAGNGGAYSTVYFKGAYSAAYLLRAYGAAVFYPRTIQYFARGGGVPAASAAPRDPARTLRHTPRIRPCTSPAAYAARRLQSSADFIRRLPFSNAKLPFAKTKRTFSKAGFRSQSGAAFCQSSTARLSKRRGTARPSKQRAPRPATLYKPYGIRRAYSIRSGNSYSSSSYGSLP